MRLTAKTFAKEILNNIENKRIILYKREKNDEFILKYGINQKDLENIILGLTENHFKEKIINKDKKIKVEYLYIFKAGVNINDGFGETYEYVYIKICEIKPGILVVSLHIDE